MKEKTESSAVCHHHRVGFLGLLITLGIVFGDIGTSPLYVILRQVVEDLVASKKVDLRSTYPSLRKNRIPGDFRFIIIHRVYYPESSGNRQQNLLMTLYALISKIGIDEPKALGLDTSMVVVERVPLIIDQSNRSVRRIIQIAEEK